MQKSVLEFGTHSLGSVLCNGVVLRRRIAKEVVSRKLHANPKNILKTRLVEEKTFFLCYRHITGVTRFTVCTRLLREFGEHS